LYGTAGAGYRDFFVPKNCVMGICAVPVLRCCGAGGVWPSPEVELELTWGTSGLGDGAGDVAMILPLSSREALFFGLLASALVLFVPGFVDNFRLSSGTTSIAVGCWSASSSTSSLTFSFSFPLSRLSCPFTSCSPSSSSSRFIAGPLCSPWA